MNQEQVLKMVLTVIWLLIALLLVFKAIDTFSVQQITCSVSNVNIPESKLPGNPEKCAYEISLVQKDRAFSKMVPGQYEPELYGDVYADTDDSKASYALNQYLARSVLSCDRRFQSVSPDNLANGCFVCEIVYLEGYQDVSGSISSHIENIDFIGKKESFNKDFKAQYIVQSVDLYESSFITDEKAAAVIYGPIDQRLQTEYIPDFAGGSRTNLEEVHGARVIPYNQISTVCQQIKNSPLLK